nr:hypothetical protein PJ912_22605 [Pectobacterium colocasium]
MHFRDAVKRTDSGRSEWSASTSIGVGATWVKLEHKKHSQQQEKIEINDISSAVYALGLLTKFHSDAPYIVIDEFDRISSIEEKEKFGTLLKQLGDKKVQ